MLVEIKNKIEQALSKFIKDINKSYHIERISPLLFKGIEDFILRGGKRIRPLLFIIGYLGFAKKEPENLYTSALSTELLHDFMLVHDDIIDKSDIRRKKPTMHKMMDKYLACYKNIKFCGQDLAILTADVIYAMAIDAFLSIKENPVRKERALRKFIEATIYTGCGEFIELLNDTKDIQQVTKQDIHKIYDFKTACYTFASPLSTAAILAGASQKQIDKLFKFGLYVGRAFQIKDDILGMFGNERRIGKSTLTDLREGKKTILIWKAYKNSNKKNKLLIRNILSARKADRNDLLKIRKIIRNSGSLDYAKKEITSLINKSRDILKTSSMHKEYKNILHKYSQELLIL
jgi:geranylgeranyl diphosphate synthase type I